MRLIIVFSLATVSAFALYQGSPALPEMPQENFFLPKDSAFSLKATYEADFVLGRKVSSEPFTSPTIHSFLNGAEIAFGCIDRFEIYTLLGSFNETITGNRDSSYHKMKIGASFGGQVGARVIGVFWGETKLGFDAKYFYGYPHLKTIEVGGHCTSATASSWQREWQVGVALSQTFAYFTPYIGANYSRFAAYFNNINSSLFSGDVSVVNTSPWGFVIGLGICADKGPFLDLEARFFDEYAFSAAAGMRF